MVFKQSVDMVETRFCNRQSSKGNNSKSINARVMVLALCLVYEFQVIGRTWLRHDFVMDKVQREITQKV